MIKCKSKIWHSGVLGRIFLKKIILSLVLAFISGQAIAESNTINTLQTNKLEITLQTNQTGSNPIGDLDISRKVHPMLYNFITNTRVITNFTVENGITNYFITNTNIIFIFYDPFMPVIDINSKDDLKIAIENMLFPMDEIMFQYPETKNQKKRRLSTGIKLLSEDEMNRFSENAFIKYLYRKTTGNLEFSPEEKKHFNMGFEQWETKIIVSGWVTLSAGYGSVFKDEAYQQALPGIFQGFDLNQTMRVNVVGKIGDRIQVNINHSSDSPDNEYEIAYKALPTDTGILKELRAGNISLNIPQSSYFVKYEGTTKDSYGLKAVFGVGDVEVQTVLNLTQNQKGYKKYVGTRQLVQSIIPDINYVKRKYFLLPDKSIDNGTIELLISTNYSYSRLVDGQPYRIMVESIDYFVNNSTGELTLINNLDRNSSLIVRYTSGGTLFTTDYNSTVGTDDKGGKYLYLWQPTKNFSPYLHNGYYNIGYRNFDPTRGFSLSVVYSSDKSKLAPFQFMPSDYVLSPINGTIKFNNPEPFPDSLGRIYTNATDPVDSDSQYTMIINFYNQVASYQLDYGIIAGTERIYVNGRLLNTSEYTIVYSIGELYFNNSSLINDNDVIEIYYEYKPFWSGSQKLGVATRIDWKPSKIFNLGSTIVYNISQRDPGAPNITATPDGVFLSDIDGILDVARLLNLSEDINLTLKAEFALSVFNPNTIGYAIIDDFENAGDSFSVSKIENKWILCAPTMSISNITYTNRGNLLYKDYRYYNLDGSFSLMNDSTPLTPDKMLDYSFKPGPYVAFGGHLDPSQYPNIDQSSLIFDYDFRQGGNWVGAALSLAGSAGVDLSEYNQITFWAKLQSDPNGDNNFEDNQNTSVDLYLAAGQLNEDSDGDGILEHELDSAQAGYDFHDYINPNIVVTHVGRGRQGGGDGFVQTEDLNGNGMLDTNENVVIFPSPGYTDLSNATVSEGSWQKFTINISSLNSTQVSNLQHVSDLGLYIVKRNGVKGRVLIDSISFNKVSWSDKIIDGILADESTAIEGDSVSVFNNPEYAANRFYNPQSSDSNTQDRSRIFEKLHGPKTISEANQYNEKSLEIVYHLSNATINTNILPISGGTTGVLIKRYSFSIDISKYKYLNYYIYIPDKDETGAAIKLPGDTYTNENLVFILGNSVNSYYKWKLPLNYIDKNAWHNIQINIYDQLKQLIDNQTIDGYDKPISTGFPNVQDINYIEIGVETSSTNEPVNNGVIWVNEMYVSSDISSIGTAYYINPSFEYKKPICSINSFEILGPLSLNFTYENRDFNFIPSEGSKIGTYNNNYDFSYSSRLFKNINYSFSINENKQGTSTNELDMPEYLQWNDQVDVFNFLVSYLSKEYIPSVNHSFTESFETKLARNLISSDSNDYIMDIQNEQYSSSAKISLNEFIPVVNGFSMNPRFSFEDSYYIIDQSNYTNDQDQFYLTNDSIFGMKDLKKSLTAGVGFSVWVFNLNGDFLQSIEKYSMINDFDGYRSDIDNQKKLLINDRYSQRLEGISQGFYFPDEPYDKGNSDSYNISFSGDRPIPYFSFWLNDRIGREATAFSYDYNSQNLLSKSEKYGLGCDYKLNLYPKEFLLLDSIQLRMNRAIDMNYQTMNSNIYYTNVLPKYGEIYYNQPGNYSAFFNGNAGRTNSLNLVTYFSEAGYNSSVNFSDTIGIDLMMSDIKNFLRNFIPNRYNFSTTLVTSRNLSSYGQRLDNLFGTSLPLRLSEWKIPFIKQDSDFRIGDIQLGFNFENIADYNVRKTTDIISGNANETLQINRYINLVLFYQLDYSGESNITTSEPFEAQYGFPAQPPNTSAMTKYSHTGRINFNWMIDNIKDLNLILFKINLRGSTVNNKEGVSITGDSIDYDGNNFTPYSQKIFEITIDHQTQLALSDYVTGNLDLKCLINQYADVAPIDSGKQITYFQPGFGFQTSIDVRIKF